MIDFKAIIKKFHQNGEKTGWTYIEIPLEVSDRLNPGIKTAYRVKGKLDSYPFEWVSTIPMGDGHFIIAINAEMRKNIKKQAGESLNVEIILDLQEKPLYETFILCLEDEPTAFEFFKTLPRGHQRYFSNWIESAKTETTKTKRIAQAVNALVMKLGFSEMIRMNKKEKLF